MFNFNHLYYFYVTARLGGVTTAAQYLRISQPSLSAQLKTLESMLERKLFEKSGRRLQLTAEGDHIYAYCRRMFEVSEHLHQYLTNPVSADKRKIRVGVSDQIERPFIADLLGDFLQHGKNHAKTLLTVTTGSDADLLQKLRSQEIDLLLNNKSFSHQDLKELVSLRMPVFLVIAKSLIKKQGYKSVPTYQEVLKNEEVGLFLPSERMRLRHEIDIFMQQRGIGKDVGMESDLQSVVARAVVDGFGCTFLPLPYVSNELRRGQLVALGPPEGLWRHRLILLARKQIQYDPLFLEIKNKLLQLNKVG